MSSNHKDPINLGTDYMVSINELAETIIGVSGKTGITRNHVEGPQGVRGRNSDNEVLRQVLGWEPQTTLADGLVETYRWIEKQIDNA